MTPRIPRRIPRRPVLAVGLAAAALAVAPGTAPAQQESIRQVVLAGRFVNAELAATSLRVQVEDHLENVTGGTVEAWVIVPLPHGATPDGLTLMIGGQRVKGDLITKEHAERVYQSLFQRQRDPAILDYVDRTTLRLRVFPIPARQTAVVTYSYTVTARRNGEGYLVRLPLKAPGYGGLDTARVEVTLDVDPEVEIGHVYSPTHPVTVTRFGAKAAQVDWKSENQRLERDLLVMVGTAGDDLGVVTTTGRDRSGRRYFLASVSPPRAVPGAGRPAGEYIFALDASSSTDPTDFEGVRRAVADAVASLDPTDRFEVMPFNTVPRPVFGDLRAATDENKAQALAALERVTPLGRTNLAGALDRVVALTDSAHGRPVVLLTGDGRASIGPAGSHSIASRIDAVRDDLRIAAFGFGEDLELGNLELLAEDTGGTLEAAGPGEGPGPRLAEYFRRIHGTGFADFTVKATGDAGVHALLPDRLSILPGDERIVIVGRYRKNGTATLRIRARHGQRELDREVEVELSESFGDDDGSVARIWAARQLGSLLDGVRRGRDSASAVAQIRELGLEFGIVTPYTDFLALEPGMRNLLERLRVNAGLVPVASEPRRSAYDRNPDIELFRRAKALSRTDVNGGLAFDDLVAAGSLGRVVGDTTVIRRADGYWCTPELVLAPVPTDAVRIEAGSDEHVALVVSATSHRSVLTAAERLMLVVDGVTYLID